MLLTCVVRHLVPPAKNGTPNPGPVGVGVGRIGHTIRSNRWAKRGSPRLAVRLDSARAQAMNRNGLCALIDQLLPWIEKTLHEDYSVSILGV